MSTRTVEEPQVEAPPTRLIYDANSVTLSGAVISLADPRKVTRPNGIVDIVVDMLLQTEQGKNTDKIEIPLWNYPQELLDRLVPKTEVTVTGRLGSTTNKVDYQDGRPSRLFHNMTVRFAKVSFSS